VLFEVLSGHLPECTEGRKERKISGYFVFYQTCNCSITSQVLFVVLSGHLPGRTEEKKEKFQDILCSIGHVIVLLFYKCYYIQIT
jgi:hypothetical protein